MANLEIVFLFDAVFFVFLSNIAILKTIACYVKKNFYFQGSAGAESINFIMFLEISAISVTIRMFLLELPKCRPGAHLPCAEAG